MLQGKTKSFKLNVFVHSWETLTAACRERLEVWGLKSLYLSFKAAIQLLLCESIVLWSVGRCVIESTQIKVNYNNCALWPSALFTNSCSVFSSHILWYTFVLIAFFYHQTTDQAWESEKKHGLLRQPYKKQSLRKLLCSEGKNKDDNLWTWHQDAQSYCEVIVDLVQHWGPAQRLLIQVGFFFYCVKWTILSGLGGCISKFCVVLVIHSNLSTYPCLTFLSKQLSLVSTLII